MTKIPVLRNLPLEGGTLYDLFRTEYTYRPNKTDKPLKEHDKVPVRIRGLVQEDGLPENNKKFKMFYFYIADTYKYGSIVLDECFNVVEEDGCYYFEDNEHTKYLLIKPSLN